MSKISLVKTIHTAIFLVMLSCLFYLLYCALTRTYNWALVVALAAISLEGIALLFNHGRCPLTTLAEKYGAEKGSVSDMFLPSWMGRHVFKVSVFLVPVEIILLALGYFSGN